MLELIFPPIFFRNPSRYKVMFIFNVNVNVGLIILF